MVRTRQTAKKSTGAPAPRITLPIAPSRIKSAKKVAVGRRRGTSSGVITNEINVTIQPDVPTHVLTVQVRGPVNLNADMDKDHDEWCTACRNGGDCLCCDSCLRVVCRRCVDYPKDASVVRCPSCHLHLGQRGKNSTPYVIDEQRVVFKGEGSTRESFLRCVSEPLAILSITLQESADDGPSKPTFEHLVPYLRGNACYINLDFNFGSFPESQSFSERLNNLVDMLESGELQRFRRFFVFLATHSDPERGDLHVSPGNQSSASTELVLQQIFCKTRFGECLRRSRDSVLALVSCGAVVSYPESVKSLHDLTAQRYFREVLAFTQPDLQPSFTSKFIQDYAINRFIHLKEGVKGYIYDHQALGAHTNLLIFTSASNPTSGPLEVMVTNLFWSHNGQRPLGNHCPQQCPTCFALRPWTPKSHSDKVEHRCKNCNKTFVYLPIPGATEITPPGPKSLGGERGTWWMTKFLRH